MFANESMLFHLRFSISWHHYIYLKWQFIFKDKSRIWMENLEWTFSRARMSWIPFSLMCWYSMGSLLESFRHTYADVDNCVCGFFGLSPSNPFEKPATLQRRHVYYDRSMLCTRCRENMSQLEGLFHWMGRCRRNRGGCSGWIPTIAPVAPVSGPFSWAEINSCNQLEWDSAWIQHHRQHISQILI